jgi:hypothetical protein
MVYSKGITQGLIKHESVSGMNPKVTLKARYIFERRTMVGLLISYRWPPMIISHMCPSISREGMV